ncbi:SRPBCC family protein [Agriterribacter sp.]|uniref:SRPBCC family protein n=1 Tax=Agriterribacter sp. TaxID=2821509 RepID=UPI002CE1F589|nr:SRPBCC family protein [Agriterribacter sp.]HRP55119.1 SRPBCC family protein [Agriterribacter sp.]
MASIHLTTFVKAPVERVFDLCRNITVYKKALESRNESLSASAAGILVNAGDTITLSARHLGKTRVMTARILEMNIPEKFVEEQVKGDLKSFRHEHHFKPVENGTLIIDLIEMEEPRDAVGGMLGKFFMKNYFEALLNKRNALIKLYAESEKWRAVMG